MYKCEIIKDSICHTRLTTFVVTYPRIVHAEMMTHRMFSRNSASSRAIPVDKMIKMVEEDPFIPTYWGKNQKGMQALEQIIDNDITKAREFWIEALSSSLYNARNLARLSVHKQTINRLLEPFSWITVIITATEFENFFNLRCHKDAQPEIQAIATMMKDEYEASNPIELSAEKWHLPFIREDEKFENLEDCIRVSVARCARVSYLNHFGIKNLEDDLRLFYQLKDSGHMSPFEHCAKPSLLPDSYFANFKGWKSYRYFLENTLTYII